MAIIRFIIPYYPLINEQYGHAKIPFSPGFSRSHRRGRKRGPENPYKRVSEVRNACFRKKGPSGEKYRQYTRIYGRPVRPISLCQKARMMPGGHLHARDGTTLESQSGRVPSDRFRRRHTLCPSMFFGRSHELFIAYRGRCRYPLSGALSPDQVRTRRGHRKSRIPVRPYFPALHDYHPWESVWSNPVPHAQTLSVHRPLTCLTIEAFPVDQSQGSRVRDGTRLPQSGHTKRIRDQAVHLGMISENSQEIERHIRLSRIYVLTSMK